MSSEHGESSNEIRADIEQTRSRMSQRVDEIQEQLSPENLKQQARSTVRELVDEGTAAISGYFQGNSGEMGRNLATTIKRNPLPAALIGLGIGWLLVEGMSSDDHSYSGSRREWQPAADPYAPYAPDRQRTSRQSPSANTTSGAVSQALDTVKQTAADVSTQVKDTVHETVETVQQIATDLQRQVEGTAENLAHQTQTYAAQARQQTYQSGHQAAYYTQQAGTQLQHSLQDNPLIFGGVAIGVGLLVGMLLPATEQENQVMGATRDQVLDSAKAVMSDVQERAQDLVEEVQPKVAQTIDKVSADMKEAGQSALQDLQATGQSALADVKQTASDAAEDLQKTAEQAGKQAAKEAEAVSDKARAEAEKVQNQVTSDTKQDK